MPLNLGAALGLGKETTTGTGVAPTLYATLNEVPKMAAKADPDFIPNTLDFGNLAAFATDEGAEFSANITVTPKFIGAVLTGLLGAPATTGTAPNFTHAFRYKTTVPSYTLTTQDGVGTEQGTGFKFTELSLKHEDRKPLVATFSGVGMSKALSGAIGTVATENTPFLNKHLTITYGGSVLACQVESVDVGVKAGKKVLGAVTSGTACDVQGDGTAEITANLKLRFSTSEFATYKNATSKTLNLTWQIDVNTSIVVNLPSVVLTADPTEVENTDLDIARVNLALKAVAYGSVDIITVKNTQVSY